MAYRQMDIKAPSYLEDFLDQIENLPSQIKSKFAEMRDMEERANSHMADAERAAADSVRKANSKGSGNDSLKKSFQEVISLQGKAVSNANRKVEVAESAFVLVDEVIRNLDEKLREFEAQLRKEGRWPASTADRPPRPSANATLQGGPTPANSASGATGARGLANAGATTTQKSRRRESTGGRGAGSTGSSHGAGGRSNTKASNTGTAAAAASAPATPTTNVATEQISVIEDMAVDPEEPLYCYCQRVSFGEMVACENNDCPHQWFHFTCVGLTVAPKGQWTCPECSKKI